MKSSVFEIALFATAIVTGFYFSVLLADSSLGQIFNPDPVIAYLNTTTPAIVTFLTTLGVTFSSKQPEQPEQTNMPLQLRTIEKVIKAIEQAEGAGARVRRSIGTAKLRSHTPFLMLDHFNVGQGAGFPDHPHRGFETITYLLSGSIDHEDFAGNKGTIGPGDLQFMTAGRGIVHAEMPGENPNGEPNIGMQLWVDLPKALKYCEPRYRDLRAEEIPIAKADDGKVEIKVISGQSQGVDSVKDLSYTPVWFLDVLIRPGGKVLQPIPRGWNAFAYTLEGSMNFSDGEGSKKVDQYHTVTFGTDATADAIEISVPEDATESARTIVVAGQIHDQEVVQHGPFVLNSREEIYQAILDYQSNTGGFERAKGWRSEIGKRMAYY